ncbi:MAG: cytochrome b/b6 domain-containing protein [Phenylobacterium sp.]
MAKAEKVLVYRHAGVTRLTHWINVLAVTFLLMSGLEIFNAHPALYWGQRSHFDQPWISMTAEQRGQKTIGVTRIGSLTLETTGVLGYSGKPGYEVARGFPAWITLPSSQDLADGRRWHFFFAWVFVLNGLAYWLLNLINGHIRKDLLPAPRDLSPRNVWHEIVTHAQLKFPKGEEARRYNILQKATYLGMVLLVLPLMVATGLTMSPGFDAAAPWLLDLFGGRQSARTIHFICASLTVLFVIVHLVMVVASGTWNNIRSMITGRYAIEVEPPMEPPAEPALQGAAE